MSASTHTPKKTHPRTSPRPKLSLLTPGKSSPTTSIQRLHVLILVPPTPSPIARVQDWLLANLLTQASPTTSTGSSPSFSSGSGTDTPTSIYSKHNNSECAWSVDVELVPSRGSRMFRADGTFITERDRRLMKEARGGKRWSLGSGKFSYDEEDEDMVWL
ncbi:hypothetical protein DM02DRAFT_622521 [Periconia macrospinosa]|uniref:Uncharacterized protein n=1 Tax=Periconia macrospinosa TaxID=97972 RepID=A0A2V1E9F1_9PLEO|nr:hypothetical protein DM02DRAFT_622521 [Periconia macrospinosa]